MIYSGGGVILSDASNKLIKLVKALGFPITNTLMGLGGYPATDKQFVGMLGMHGTYEANMAMQNCDVLLAIGARFDDRVIGNPAHFNEVQRKIIHIDIDPSSISKRVKVDVPIVGNVPDVLEDLLKQLEAADEKSDAKALALWWKQIETWRAKDCLKYKQNSKVIMPQYVIEKLYEVTGGDAIVTSDVGQHQMWAAQYYKFDKPRRWINSGGLGTMALVCRRRWVRILPIPRRPWRASPGKHRSRCASRNYRCKQYRLPIKIINLNNRYLGMVRQWREMFHGNRYAESYVDALPDFVKLAESYGHVGMHIDKPANVEAALREAFTTHKNELVFMDFITDQTANVFPMIAAGKGLSEMILAEDL